MFKQKLFAPKTGLFLLIIAGLFLMNTNFAEAVEWKTITDLPGLPAGKPVTLDNFIIVLYDFLLSAVGIAAMFMIVIGGFRYLTAAGNAAALSEAKDIIYSALYGLLLAISVWVIVSTINPDLVYLKQPGTTVSPKNYNCMLAGTACVAGDNCCYGVCVGGVCPEKPVSCIDPTSSEDQESCDCIDGTSVAKAAGKNCTETCRPNNCLVVDARIGHITYSWFGPAPAPKDEVEKAAVYDSNPTIPLELKEDATIAFNLSVVNGIPLDMTQSYYIDANIDGSCAGGAISPPTPILSGLPVDVIYPRSYFTMYFSYADVSGGGYPLCKASGSGSYTCPVKICVTDTNGNTASTEIYFKMLAP